MAHIPSEAMYAAQEALNRAAALLGVLRSLHHLADELTNELEEVDGDTLHREALRTGSPP